MKTIKLVQVREGVTVAVVDEALFASVETAKDILDSLRGKVLMDGVATMRNYYDILGYPELHEGEDFMDEVGWVSVEGMTEDILMESDMGGFIIDLPHPKRLKGGENP